MKARAAAHALSAEATLKDAWMLSRTGRSDEALAIAAAVHSWACAEQDQALACRSVSDMAWYCLQMGQAAQGLKHAQSALAIARALGDAAADAKARAITAWLMSELGDMEEAIEEAHLALRLAESAGNAEVLCFAVNVVGIIFWLCRQPDRAIEFCTRAVALARELGDPVMLGWWLINLGGANSELAYAARARGDEATFRRALAEAIAWTEESEGIAAASGDPWGRRVCLGNLAEYHVEAENYATAKAYLDRYAGVIGGDFSRNREHYLYTLGQALTHLGRLDEAADALLRAIVVAEETGNPDTVVHAARYLADVYERQGDHARALDYHRRFHDAYVKLSAAQAQQQARLAEVRYEIDKLRSVADSESRRASELEEVVEGLREARVEAEQASLAKSRFLANMSHELRTPLNAIIGFSDMMRLGVYGAIAPNRYSEYVDVIHNSAHDLLELINDLLDLSKIEAGKMDLLIRPLETSALGAAVRRVVGQMAEQKGVTLEVAPSPEVPVIHADERAIRQILINLVTNAVKFTPAGGRVTVRFEQARAGGIDILVADTGSGLTEEEIEIALQPYGQVQSNPAVKYEGTGLGLPLVKALAELHGGRLDLASRKGEGTTAIVHLP